MSKLFDWTSTAIQDLFRYQTVNYLANNPYFFLPIVAATANGIDAFLVSREKPANEVSTSRKGDNLVQEKQSLELTSRLISFNLIDIPSVCCGSLVTYYLGQSRNIINTMLNTRDTALIEGLSVEMSIMSEKLGNSREYLKALVLMSGVTNAWFLLTNWHKGRTGWVRMNLRKATLVSNLIMFFLLSKPVNVEIN